MTLHRIPTEAQRGAGARNAERRDDGAQCGAPATESTRRHAWGAAMLLAAFAATAPRAAAAQNAAPTPTSPQPLTQAPAPTTSPPALPPRSEPVRGQALIAAGTVTLIIGAALTAGYAVALASDASEPREPGRDEGGPMSGAEYALFVPPTIASLCGISMIVAGVVRVSREPPADEAGRGFSARVDLAPGAAFVRGTF